MKNALGTDMIQGDPECSYKHFTAAVKSPIDPDATIDVECFMSTDSVDADDEVMLPDGIDLSRFNKNPVVMLCHAMGQPGCFYPLPVGKALWTKQARRGVLAGVRFSRDTEMGRQVKALFDEQMLKSFSVGFRPLEVSAMTRKEAESRPDWQEAFNRTKGHVRVHRKWSLVELSVAPVPSNPDALVTSYKAKGIVVPSWLNLKSEDSMDNDEPEIEDAEDKATECKCGKDGCDECQARMNAKAEDEVDDESDDLDDEDDDESPEPEEKAMDEESDDDDEDFNEEDEADLPIKTRDHVDVKAKGFKGCGMVEKIHRKGFVDHVDEDVVGTKDDPAARVRLYKAHGDGHAPTERRMGVKLSQLTKRAEPFKTPSKKAFAETETKGQNSPIGEKPEPLPPLVALSEAQFQEAAIKQACQAAVDRINEMFGVV